LTLSDMSKTTKGFTEKVGIAAKINFFNKLKTQNSPFKIFVRA